MRLLFAGQYNNHSPGEVEKKWVSSPPPHLQSSKLNLPLPAWGSFDCFLLNNSSTTAINSGPIFKTKIFHHNTTIPNFPHFLATPPENLILVYTSVSVNWFTNSEIFFSDFENIFPYFLTWSGNKFESPLI